MREWGHMGRMHLASTEMNGFNNWRGLKRPFHNYCLPLLDYGGAGGWQGMDEVWREPCRAGRQPFVNTRRIKRAGALRENKHTHTCIMPH